MDEFKLSKQQVADNGTITLPRADGAHGRRHHPRGLWGYWDPPKKRRADEAIGEKIAEARKQFIGFTIRKGGQV